VRIGGKIREIIESQMSHRVGWIEAGVRVQLGYSPRTRKETNFNQCFGSGSAKDECGCEKLMLFTGNVLCLQILYRILCCRACF
jgi:hypothetical protein